MGRDLLDDFRDKAPDTFCAYPFTYVNFGHDGRIDPCCSAAFGVVKPEDLDKNFWNGELFRSIRKDLLAGAKPEGCGACWRAEKLGMVSMRQERFDYDRFRDFFNQFTDYDPETGRLASGPTQIKVSLSNLCNLQCRMCGPEFSSRWENAYLKNPQLREWMKANDINIGMFERQPSPGRHYVQFVLDFIKENAKSLRQLEMLGGEPIIQPEHLEALKAVEGFEHQITLNYSSNFTRFKLDNEDLFARWAKFRGLEINLSMDGVGELNDYIRWGADHKVMEKNLRELRARFPAGSTPALDIFSYCTISVYNILQIVELARHITRLGVLFISGQAEAPRFLSIQILPEEIKKRVTAEVGEFIARLPESLNEDFAANEYWNSSWLRHEQCERVRRRLTDILNFMNGEGRPEDFKHFFEFDRIFNESYGSRKSVFDFYPEWRRYV